VAPDWWMATAPTGHPYYHNTATGETTWTEPEAVKQHKQSPSGSQSVEQSAMAYLSTIRGGSSGQSVVQQQGDGGASASNLITGADNPDITVTGNGHIPQPWTTFDQVQMPQMLIRSLTTHPPTPFLLSGAAGVPMRPQEGTSKLDEIPG
ncbi:unnamed protein product, partial [Prorocentrum cordatum]